jgi:hypothetical protein
MKHLLKLTAAVTLGLCVSLASCKKSDSPANAPATKTTDYKALSKRIALNLYKSLNTGSAGFKASATGGRKALSTGPQCGDVVYSPYNESATSGDTTRYYSGNSVFTYICNGGVMNEYSLVDTATSRELRTGFASTYRVIQKYNTRATNDAYTQSVSNGTIGVAYAQRQSNNGGATTDSLSYATQYQLNSVVVTRSNNQSLVTGGQAVFTASVFHKDNGDDINGYTEAHNGVITFEEGDVIKVTFSTANYSGSFLVNVKTGEVTQVS